MFFETDVLAEQLGERSQRAQVPALGLREPLTEGRMLGQHPIDEIRRAGIPERGEELLFLHREVGRELVVERVAYGGRKRRAFALAELAQDAPSEHERVVVVRREALETRVAFHRGPG
ncbi:MAG: hypothetical protein QM820_22525 [Minicystis sp.]